MNQLSWTNNQLKLPKSSGKLPIVLEEFMKRTPHFNKGNTKKMSNMYVLDNPTD